MRWSLERVSARAVMWAMWGALILLTVGVTSASAQSAEAPTSEEAEPVGLQIRVDILVGGGTVMAWDAPEEAGNSYGGGVGVTLHPGLKGLYGLRVAITGAGILPDSRFQGHFGALWVDLQYRPFTPWYHLEPYLVVGAGLAFPDQGDPSIIPGLPPATQWSTSHQFLGLAGLGLSYGAPTGLFVAVDVRAVNLTHGTVNLLAGYRF